MSRKQRFHIGDSHAGFTLVEAAANLSGGNSNIRCKLTCDTCGSLQIGWKANWYSGKLSCNSCGRVKRENDVHRFKPFAVYDPQKDTFTLCWNAKPRDVSIEHKVYKFQDGETATLYTTQKRQLVDISVNPDAGHTHAFPMKQSWVEYFTTGIRPSDHEEADNHILSLLDIDYQPRFSTGSGSTWKEEGITYAYLYVDC